jgi:hypothetical protein
MPRVFAQQPGKGGTGKFYEKGSVRIHYEEAGSGFPLMLLPGGGLNSTISFFTGNSPFNAIEEFKGRYRCITADLRNAPSGQSTGPVEVDRSWDSLRGCQNPILVLPDDVPAHPYAVAMACAMLAPKAEVSIFPWKEPKERIPLAVRQIHSFLKAHRPA